VGIAGSLENIWAKGSPFECGHFNS